MKAYHFSFLFWGKRKEFFFQNFDGKKYVFLRRNLFQGCFLPRYMFNFNDGSLKLKYMLTSIYWTKKVFVCMIKTYLMRKLKKKLCHFFHKFWTLSSSLYKCWKTLIFCLCCIVKNMSRKRLFRCNTYWCKKSWLKITVRLKFSKGTKLFDQLFLRFKWIIQ